MGLFSYLFGKEPPIQPPVLVSILPPQAAQRIYAGILPNLQADKLILNIGETCHFVDVAAIITEKKHYESRHDGASFRVFKGFTYHTGDKMMFSVNEKMRVLDRILYRKGMTYDIKVYGFYDAQDDSWISIERYEKLLMEMYEDGLIEIGNLINAIDRSTGIPDYRRTHIKALNDGIKFYEDHMTNSAIGFC